MSGKQVRQAIDNTFCKAKTRLKPLIDANRRAIKALSRDKAYNGQ
jgi:hypothetical protein